MSQMVAGGQWLQPPHDAPPVFVPPAQLEPHRKRFLSEGWAIIADPRSEESASTGGAEAPTPAQIGLEARLDRLEAMFMQFLTSQSQKSEPTNGDTTNDDQSASQSSANDSRPGGRKSTARRSDNSG